MALIAPCLGIFFKKPKVLRNMLIITGTGRSGTGMFARLFGGYHEFRVAYLLDKYFSLKDPHANPFDRLEKRIMAIKDLHQGIDPERFIDSSNLYIHFLDAIYYLNPSAKIILGVRNGKDFTRSGITRKWHEQNSFGIVPLRNDPYFDRWNEMTLLQKNAWIWTHRNRIALEGLKVIPDSQRLIVKIEDCTSDATLDQLEQFAGVPIIDRSWAGRRYNANPTYTFPPKEEWSDAMHKDFDEIAGEMMAFLGY